MTQKPTLHTSIATALAASLSLAHAVLSAEQCGWGIRQSPLQQRQPACLDEHASASDPGAWAPWTHRPYCIVAADGPYCVFTNAALPSRKGGNGLSIITRPELAASPAAVSLFAHDVDFLSRAPTTRGHNETLNKLASSGGLDDPPFEVRDVPGKGKGAIATRRIEQGRVVLVDHAAILAADEYPADLMREEVQDLLRRGIAQLRDPAKVYALARKGEGRGDESMSDEEDLLLTNSFAVTVGDESYMALFPELAVSVLKSLCRNSGIIRSKAEAWSSDI